MTTPRDFVKQDSTLTLQQRCENFLDQLAAKGATDSLFLFEELLEAFPKEIDMNTEMHGKKIAAVLAPYRKPFARESFEAWASDAYKWPNAIERSGEGYRLMQTQASWEAWSMAFGSAEAACAERIREADDRCSAWADIAGAHGAQADRLRALLREVSANRWECATEDGACPDCGADDGEPHESGCLLGRVDAEIETAAPLRKAEDMSPNDLGLSHWPC